MSEERLWREAMEEMKKTEYTGTACMADIQKLDAHCREPEEARPVCECGHDPVKHPSYYTENPSGIECIEITKHMNFCLGNAIKYIWRAGKKGDYVEDLRKAIQYLEFEIGRVKKL